MSDALFIGVMERMSKIGGVPGIFAADMKASLELKATPPSHGIRSMLRRGTNGPKAPGQTL